MSKSQFDDVEERNAVRRISFCLTICQRIHTRACTLLSIAEQQTARICMGNADRPEQTRADQTQLIKYVAVVENGEIIIIKKVKNK